VLFALNIFTPGTCTTKRLSKTQESNLLHPNKMYNQNLSQQKKLHQKKNCAFDTKKLKKHQQPFVTGSRFQRKHNLHCCTKDLLEPGIFITI